MQEQITKAEYIALHLTHTVCSGYFATSQIGSRVNLETGAKEVVTFYKEILASVEREFKTRP